MEKHKVVLKGRGFYPVISMTNQCAYCNHQLNPSDKFCSACGNPIKSGAIASKRGNAPEYQQLGTPIPELRNPQGLLRSGDLTLRIEGEVVPVVDVQLGQQQSIYFEHHILLWKHPNVRLGVISCSVNYLRLSSDFNPPMKTG